MIIVRIVDGVVAHLFRRAPEWVLAGITLTFGWVLLRPSDIFNSAPAFRVLASMATEDTWGSVFLLLGVARLLTLTINGTFRQFPWSPHCRALGAFANCFLWFSVSIGLYASGVPSTGVAVYPGLLMLEAVNCIVAAAEAGEIGRRRRHGHPS